MRPARCSGALISGALLRCATHRRAALVRYSPGAAAVRYSPGALLWCATHRALLRCPNRVFAQHHLDGHSVLLSVSST